MPGFSPRGNAPRADPGVPGQIVVAAVLGAAAYPAAARYVRTWRDGQGSAGTMQGGALSPLLSNIYLDEFDQALLQRGVRLARYADDFVLAVPDERSAHAALELAARELHKLRLKLNPAKTRIQCFSAGEVVWLGYRFHPQLIAAAPAPVDESLSFAAWWQAARQSVLEAPAKVAAQVTPKATQLGEQVKARVSAGLSQVKARWRKQSEPEPKQEPKPEPKQGKK